MPVVPPARRNLFSEEVDFRSGLSEALFFGIAGETNFLNQRVYEQKAFRLNGNITGLDGEEGVDGFQFAPFDAEIFDVFVYQRVIGTGTTELDVKFSEDGGATFNSIFSTRPAITASASNNVFFRIGDSVTGTTAPVLTGTVTSDIDGKTVKEIADGAAFKMDIITSQSSALDAGIVIFYRSR